MKQSAKDLLIEKGALRQFIHNDNSGFTFGYDLEITEKLVSNLMEKKQAIINDCIDNLESILTEVRINNIGNKTINSITTYIYNIFKCEVNKSESEVEK